jgi:integrative and conjugative element protein (TIGR02256 family)
VEKAFLTECEGMEIVFSNNILNKMLSFRQSSGNLPESGGIITGLIYNHAICAIDCSIPTSYDKQNRFNFIRSKEGAQCFLDEKFLTSRGREIYLGEWHTHPENSPKPSTTDLSSFKKTIKNNLLNSHIFIMVIIGLCEIYIGVFNNLGQLIKAESIILQQNSKQ